MTLYFYDYEINSSVLKKGGRYFGLLLIEGARTEESNKSHNIVCAAYA
jgi:hypothetical protein